MRAIVLIAILLVLAPSLAVAQQAGSTTEYCTESWMGRALYCIWGVLYYNFDGFQPMIGLDGYPRPCVCHKGDPRPALVSPRPRQEKSG